MREIPTILRAPGSPSMEAHVNIVDKTVLPVKGKGMFTSMREMENIQKRLTVIAVTTANKQSEEWYIYVHIYINICILIQVLYLYIYMHIRTYIY